MEGHFGRLRVWAVRRPVTSFYLLASVLTCSAAAARIGQRSVRRWGATPSEAAGPLPGDDLILEGTNAATYAVTVNAPPEYVWPWIAQLGRGRAGFYTYTWIENALGADIHNLYRIDPSLPRLRVGDRVWLTPELYLGRLPGQFWTVRLIDEDHALVLEQRPPDNPSQGTWALVTQADGAGGTRLLSRKRNPQPVGLPSVIGDVFWLVGAFLMEQKMLRTIRRLAESEAHRRLIERTANVEATAGSFNGGARGTAS